MQGLEHPGADLVRRHMWKIFFVKHVLHGFHICGYVENFGSHNSLSFKDDT